MSIDPKSDALHRVTEAVIFSMYGESNGYSPSTHPDTMTKWKDDAFFRYLNDVVFHARVQRLVSVFIENAPGLVGRENRDYGKGKL